MITENQLKKLAIQWHQDTGSGYEQGSVIAPEGKSVEREDYQPVVLKGRPIMSGGRPGSTIWT